MKPCSLNKEQRESWLPYLLGELPDNMVKVLEWHLMTGCPSCDREVAQLRESLTLLAYSASPAEPSPQAREKLLARLASEANNSPPLTLVEAEKRVYTRSLGWLGRIAASLVVLMLLAETVYLIEYRKNAKQQEASQKAKIELLEKQIDKKEKLITSMGTSRKLIVLDGKLIKASGKAFWDTNHNTWLFYIEKLPPAPKGKVYQLWFITDEQMPVSGGIFQTDDKGCAHLPLTNPLKAGKIVAAAVSLEPEGGSHQPRGAIYLSGPVS